MTGGIGWQLLYRINVQYLNIRSLFEDVLPYCFVPVTLPLCTIVVWSFLATRETRPTLLRGLLAVLASVALSIVLVFLLDWVGVKALLTVFPLSSRAAIEVRGVSAQAWSNALVQSGLLLVPCLIIGGVFSRWQERFWRRYMQ
jgi:hypothetical protein